MKLTSILFLAASLAAGSLVVMEGDVRTALPTHHGITLYFVSNDWFIAQAPESWGTPVSDSAEGLYLAHLADPDAEVPGEVLFRRDGIALFRPTSPLPMRAFPGIRLIVPLRPISSETVPPPFAPGLRDTGTVEEILEQVNEDSLKAHIQHLEDFVTRLCVAPEYFQSALWVADKLQSYGLESVEVDTFDFQFYGNTYESANVFGEIPGTLPDPGIILITAHLDAITYTSPYDFAPGADDNGSGSAAVIEAARVMSQFEFPNTVRFVCFGAEELGLIGSEYYAANSAAAGEAIVAVMNLDMILYGPESNRALFVPYNGISTDIAGMFTLAASEHVPELDINVIYSPGTTYSDHASFWQYGYPALLGIEAAVNSNPYYHQDTDILSNYDEFWPFGTECAKAAIAFTAHAALTDWMGMEDGSVALPDLSVFPNPAGYSITVTFGGSPAQSVSVYDLNGRRILNEQGSTVDVSGLASGAYLVRASLNGGTSSSLFAVTR